MIEGRITSSLKVTGTNTTRLASSKFLSFFGTNLQNPTESLMRCIIPRDNHKFGQPDQAGAEALIVAMETAPGKFRRLFDLGLKVHSYMALQLFTDDFKGNHPASRYKGVQPDDLINYLECKDIFNRIKNAPTPYYIGKKTIHSFNYDEGIRTFILTVLEESYGKIRLSFAQGKEFKAIWEATFPEILGWQKETIERGKRDRVLRNLFGFPRLFGQLHNDSVERQMLAFVPQSTVGSITNIAYTELWHRIKKEKLPWQMLNNKHDSFLVDFPDTKEHEEMFIAYSKEHMGRELVSSHGEHYRMKVGISLGYNWGHWDKDENPDGLKEI